MFLCPIYALFPETDCKVIDIICARQKCVEATCYECHKKARNMRCPFRFYKTLEGNMGCTNPKLKRGCYLPDDLLHHLDGFCAESNYRRGGRFQKSKGEVEQLLPSFELEDTLNWARRESFGGMTIYSDVLLPIH